MEPAGALGGYFSGSCLALAHSHSRQHLVELASGCAFCRLIARRDCVKSHMVFAEEGDGGMRMLSRASYRGMGDILRSLVALRPLHVASANSLKTFSKKCLTEIVVLLV